MTAPPLLAAMRFSGEWRDYQARVLAGMDDHLADGRLHVVAAPGSGKTVLGLEAMRRLARPAVVLSPSLTIRNQWRERLCPLFLPDLATHDGRISRDLATPADITLATYQALYAAHRADADYAALKALGPVTLVLDECHHLRREWWNALFALREALDDITIVALTATPPYDASHAEWSRYERLCGDIDEEIGVPELVRKGDLAPHQDHVIFSQASGDVAESLLARRERVYRLFRDIRRDEDLPAQVAWHPFLTEPENHEEAILEAPEQLASLLFYLASRGEPLPEEPLRLLGVEHAAIPEFNHFWIAPLFECLLHRRIDGWDLPEHCRTTYARRFSEAGLVTNGRIDFDESVELGRLLAGSTGKLQSVAEIAQAETASLGEALRMAVLTDHVRATELPRDPDAAYDPARLGVVPIFETLRRSDIDQPLGVLTGTLVIIPDMAREAARLAAADLGIPPADLAFTPLPGQPGFVQLELAQAADRGRVALVTQLVCAGHIRVLVGTQALLGEGWDAPVLNSLVLASNAASYMLSNQMRGRAIRTDPAAPGKVANIWHLATVDPAAIDGSEGADVARLERRFSMFDGVAEGGEPLIENGMERLDIPFGQDIAARNGLTLQRAADRPATAQHWQQSLGGGTHRAQVREVAEVTGPVGGTSFQARSTLRSLAFSSAGGGVLAAGLAVRGLAELGMVLAVGGGAALIYALPGLFNSARLWLRNGTLEGRLQQVGEAVLLALARLGKLSQDEHAYSVIVHGGLKGHHVVTIDGGTRADQHRFVEAVTELLGPVENPRYLLRREGKALGRRQVDYHAVPTLLAGHRDHVDLFRKLWSRHVGPVEAIYTRSAEGRRVLLQARARSMAAGMQSPAQRRSMWL